VAQTNIYKLSSTLLRLFEFELADPREREMVVNGEFFGQLPDLISVGISDLKKPLLVRVKLRS
jgi:hypothetical protein